MTHRSEAFLRYGHKTRTRLLIDCEGTARSKSLPSEGPPKSGPAVVNVPPQIYRPLPGIFMFCNYRGHCVRAGAQSLATASRTPLRQEDCRGRSVYSIETTSASWWLTRKPVSEKEHCGHLSGRGDDSSPWYAYGEDAQKSASLRECSAIFQPRFSCKTNSTLWLPVLRIDYSKLGSSFVSDLMARSHTKQINLDRWHY